MSARRLSSAGFLALGLFARASLAQTAQTTEPASVPSPAMQAPHAPTAAMPQAPAMPQVPTAAAPANDDVVQTPFGPVTRAQLAAPPVARPPTKPASTKSAPKEPAKEKATAKEPAKEEPAPAPAPAGEPSAVILAPAPLTGAPAPAASAEPQRSWLREKPKAAEAPVATKEEPATSPWRALFALLVVAGLGGFALMQRYKRGKTQALPPSASRIVVLSQARIGPKANAVVAEVAGRVFLLGVTDSSVSRLAVLDKGPRVARAQNALAAAKAERSVLTGVEADDARAAFLRSRRAPVETADLDDHDEPAATRPLSSKFGEMLDRALGVKSSPAGVPDFRGNPAVAALLAGDVEDVLNVPNGVERTHDVTPARHRAAGRNITAEIVEDQAAGLSRKRRRA